MTISLMTVMADVSPYYAFEQSDMLGKAIVGLLVLGSVMTWTIMLEKWFTLRRARLASWDFIGRFHEIGYPLSMRRAAFDSVSPAARIFEAGAERLMEFHHIDPEVAENYGPRAKELPPLSNHQIEAVVSEMEREVSVQILLLEEKMGILATAVSVAPFCGLFGTVWGVMMAFCGLATAGRADIAALAPGVSGALLTTVVGLTVAIPSLVGYNILTFEIRKLTVYMDNFVDDFEAKIKLAQME